MTRQEIESKILINNQMIQNIKEANKDLRRQSYLLCDEKQWFTEEEENIIVSLRPKKSKMVLIGKIHWIEKWNDESNGESIDITRNEIVKINGAWVNDLDRWV